MQEVQSQTVMNKVQGARIDRQHKILNKAVRKADAARESHKNLQDAIKGEKMDEGVLNKVLEKHHHKNITVAHNAVTGKASVVPGSREKLISGLSPSNHAKLKLELKEEKAYSKLAKLKKSPHAPLDKRAPVERKWVP